jgi:hypothetical protein
MTYLPPAISYMLTQQQKLVCNIVVMAISYTLHRHCGRHIMLDTQEILTQRELLDSTRLALKGCEAEVQQLLASAASSGLYDDIERIATIARSLDEMAASVQSAQRLERHRGVPSLAPSTTGQQARSRKTTRAKDYPKFSRDGEYLVKTGWSKKNREEYLHRARFDHALSIAEYLSTANPSRPVPIEEILAVRDREGAPIPSYQVYVVIAWLRQEGLVERVGRSGYRVGDPDALRSTVSDLASSLAEFKVAHDR